MEAAQSLVNYYRAKRFNPVLIPVENRAVWKEHIQKRYNLYTRHLGLPLPFWRGARVLEFGANSGENGLVAALFGARLTLVEPNEQVHGRIRELFERFQLTQQIDNLACLNLEKFPSENAYDIVLAEGFLFTLPNRTAMLRKLVELIRPGGFGVISYMDRIGGLLEAVRKLYLLRACALSGVCVDRQEDQVGAVAQRLFAADYARLNASRSFDAWWRDTLVNPLVRGDTLWSLPEILDVLATEGCEVGSTSPLWSTADHYTWYKNVPAPEERHQRLLRDWRDNLLFFITGRDEDRSVGQDVTDDLLDILAGLVNTAHDPRLRAGQIAPTFAYPEQFRAWLARSVNPTVRQLDQELAFLFEKLNATDTATLIAAWHAASIVRKLWGTPYHYVSFQRTLDW